MNPPEIKLTGDERLAIHDLVTSEAWKVLTEKVWGPQIAFYREVCCSSPQDHRFAQGCYQGFGFAAQMAVDVSLPKDEINRVLPVTEADLMARRRAPSGY